MKITRPKPRSILSIDVGRKRIGLAGCDPLGITVTPLQPLARGSFKDDIVKIKSHCFQRQVEGLVVGLPLDSQGLPTEQSKYCTKYGQKLGEALQLPLAWVNEHTSTWSAGKEYNLHTSDQSGKIDSAAAAILLEQWLREGPELKPVYVAAPPDSNMK